MMPKYKGKEINTKPSEGMVSEARKGLEWRKEHGRGGTEVGVARARDIVNGKELSLDTVKRMRSFFARHEVDKLAEGFSPGEDGYPSAGRIAWALWGGDAGQSWANKIVKSMDSADERQEELNMEDDEKDINEIVDDIEANGVPEPVEEKPAAERAAPDALSVGDFVSWDSSGGRATGKIDRIERDGSIDFPGADVTVNGTDDDPAALITLYRDGEATDTKVAHRFSTLTKVSNPEERAEEVVVEHRAMELDMSPVDEEKRTARIAISSEEPVERSFGKEVLEHTAEAIDLSFFAN